MATFLSTIVVKMLYNGEGYHVPVKSTCYIITAQVPTSLPEGAYGPFAIGRTFDRSSSAMWMGHQIPDWPAPGHE